MNFQKARDSCTITPLRSKPCKGWQPESDQKQGFRNPGPLSHLWSLLQCTWQLASAYIPSWLSSTAQVSRGLTPLLSFRFRNPRERLWLAQLGPDTRALTNQLWPGGCGHMRYAAFHWTSGAASTTASKGEGCGARRKVVADWGYLASKWKSLDLCPGLLGSKAHIHSLTHAASLRR